MNKPLATGSAGASDQTDGAELSLTTQQMVEKLGGMLGADA